ncbi:hypothetical protein QCA50_013439 [Cerrena zonata]|uniref:F-box domain-containing protein n=1 Tax=Cerrena zonata TaxID=2478898 RepID=A0AAW0FS36_9APHY
MSRTHLRRILGLPDMPLNWDVLMLIMEFLDRRTLLAYMSTCHTLHRAGVPYLLSDPIRFKRSFNVKSFCQFALGDFPHRLRCLHELEFPARFWLRKRDTITLLAQVLKYSPYLEKITIIRAERFFGIDPILGDAIAESTSIKEFFLDGVGYEALSVLTRMQSPLESVDLFIDAGAVENYPDPNEALERFALGLTHLKVRWVQMGMSVQYPKVRILSIEDDNFVPIDLLIYVFPNLQSLTISTNTSEYLEMDQAELKRIHLQNKKSQRSRSWPRLDYLEGDVTLLYCLAPTCRVRRLSAWVSSSDVDKLLVVCKNTQPESLKLYFHMDRLSVDELEKILKSGDIRSISLTIDAYNMGLRDLKQYFERFRDLFRTLTISVLYFRVIWGPYPRRWLDPEEYDRDDDEEYNANPAGTNPLKEFFKFLTLDRCTLRAAKYIKTLRYAFFDMPGKPMRYYEITRPSRDEIGMEQLSSEVGEQIVQETFESPS